MEEKIDLRIKRTKKMIVMAFFKLVNEKGFDAITVKDIANEAMINRATFYAHFKDKPDLYEQIMKFAIENLASVLDTVQLVKGNRVHVKKIEFLITKIFIVIKENSNFFLTLTEGSSSELFRRNLGELLTEKYQDVFSRLKITENDIEVPVDFIIEYMTSIFVGTVHWWVSTDSDFPPEHMSQLVVKLIGNGHLTILGIEVER